MHIIQSLTQPITDYFQNNDTPQCNRQYLGTIHSIQDALPENATPSHLRCALQGEGVLSRYSADEMNNYLCSVNAQTCVVATLYNKENQTGAVIHFDHNISNLIDQAISETLSQLQCTNSHNITSTLTGGIWLMAGDSIGEPVKTALSKHGINTQWDQWALSPCIPHNYGVVLNLEDGSTKSFEQPDHAVRQFLNPLLCKANNSSDLANEPPEVQRAHDFMTRFMSPAISERGDQFIFTDSNIKHTITAEDINKFRFNIHNI